MVDGKYASVHDWGHAVDVQSVRDAPLSDEHDVSDERVEELRTTLGAVGMHSIHVSREVTFELDAQRCSDAMADVAELLFALSWRPVCGLASAPCRSASA